MKHWAFYNCYITRIAALWRRRRRKLWKTQETQEPWGFDSNLMTSVFGYDWMLCKLLWIIKFWCNSTPKRTVITHWPKMLWYTYIWWGKNLRARNHKTLFFAENTIVFRGTIPAPQCSPQRCRYQNPQSTDDRFATSTLHPHSQKSSDLWIMPNLYQYISNINFALYIPFTYTRTFYCCFRLSHLFLQRNKAYMHGEPWSFGPFKWVALI